MYSLIDIRAEDDRKFGLGQAKLGAIAMHRLRSRNASAAASIPARLSMRAVFANLATASYSQARTAKLGVLHREMKNKLGVHRDASAPLSELS